MLLTLEPFVFFICVTNGWKVLKIISSDARWKLKVFYGLLRDGKPILYGHLLLAYDDGNHELIYGCDGLVEMYVS